MQEPAFIFRQRRDPSKTDHLTLFICSVSGYRYEHDALDCPFPDSSSCLQLVRKGLSIKSRFTITGTDRCDLFHKTMQDIKKLEQPGRDHFTTSQACKSDQADRLVYEFTTIFPDGATMAFYKDYKHYIPYFTSF